MEFGIIVLIIFFVSFVLPIVNTNTIKRLEREVDELKTRLARYERGIRAPAAGASQTPAAAPEKPLVVDAAWAVPQPPASKPAAPAPIRTRKTPSFAMPSFDRLLARLPVWIGAVALVFACLYFVKYSIEAGLLSPAVRLLVGAGASALAIGAGYFISGRHALANNERIAQALTGAGVAGLYICAYMGAHLYGLISEHAAILAMGGVTAIAVFLSLRIGVPVALLGLLGGFALPLLTQFQQVNTGSLFTYFFVLTLALVFIASLRGWGWLAALALLAFYGWGFSTLFERAHIEHTAIFVGGFSLLTIFGILVLGAVLPRLRTRHEKSQNIIERSLILSFVLSTAAMIISMFNIYMSLATTGMYALLVVGAAVMAIFRQRLYLHGAFAAIAVFAGLLLIVKTLQAPALLLGLATFATLTLIGYRAMWQDKTLSFNWSVYTTAAIVGGFFVAFFKNALLPVDMTAHHGWEALAVLLSAASAYTFIIHTRRGNAAASSIWAVCGAFFAALAPLLFFKTAHFGGLALLAQAAALALIYARYNYAILARFVPIFFGLAAFFLLGEAARFVTIALRELHINASIIDFMMQQMADARHLFITGTATTILCGVICYGLHRGFVRDDGTASPRHMPYAVIAGLVALGSIYTFVQLVAYGYIAAQMPVVMIQAYFFTRTGITVLVTLLALALAVHYRQHGVLLAVATAALWFGLARTLYFDLLLDNPLWHGQRNVGDMPAFNMLLPLYLLPALVTAFFAWKATGTHVLRSAGVFASVSALLAFVFVTYSVRQWYHGGNLAYGPTSTLEVFSYSVVWLLFGLAVVTGGTLTRIRAVRMAGALMVALVIAKVFLYDAATLDGLYRVFAFIGLGLSLLLLSWFYGRLERRETQNSPKHS